MSMTPWVSYMRSTLGAIQIEQGELEAGIDNAL
jgi:hypothetical protein